MSGKCALVVIDMQNWSVNRYTKGIPGRLAAHLEKNIDRYDYVLFTKSRNTKNFGLYKFLGVHSGTKGKQLEMRKEIRKFIKKENLFNKVTYSAFKSKKFSDFLKRKGVTRLYLCGINTDKCVIATAFEAFDLGYEVRLVKGLTGSVDGNGSHRAALKTINSLIPKAERV